MISCDDVFNGEDNLFKVLIKFKVIIFKAVEKELAYLVK